MEKLGFILLVDDSKNDVELTRRALVQNNLANDIVVLQDGAEALDFLFCRGKYISRTSGDPIFVLLDIKMPKVNGLEVLAEVRKHERMTHIPVVMLTSSRQDPDVEKCYSLRANAYVVKPVDFDQFANAVKTLGKFWAVLNELPRRASQEAASAK